MDRELKDDLEYNDGVGDMLKEKEASGFSWQKLLIGGGVVLGVALLGMAIGFFAAKHMMVRSALVKLSNETAKPAPAVTVPTLNANVQTTTPNQLPVTKTSTPSAQSTQVTQPAISVASHRTSLPKKTEVNKSLPQQAEVKKVEPVAHDKRPIKKLAEKPQIKKEVVKKTKTVREYPYKVVIGEFSTLVSANIERRQLAGKGISGFVTTTGSEKGNLYHVQVGAFTQPQEAESWLAELTKKGYSGFIIKK